MSKKIYEISLTSISYNGLMCKNFEIEWEKPSCANIKCDFDGVRLKVTVPDGCEGECIYANVVCKDNNCSDCPQSERIKICPCSSNADCKECEECINNLCISTCPDDKICYNDKCVECDPDNPCPNNQICVNGKCTCPPNLPYLDDKGFCRACLDDEHCPPCTTCTPQGCKPIVCPIGVCDPLNEECVECINSGDCTGVNECCVDKHCECCKGFKRDYTTGLCIPDDECKTDGDCKECEVCVNGECKPLQCPTGFICVDGDCKPECDCSTYVCDEVSACIHLNSSQCYCNECTGGCNDSSDCGEGCYCKNGKCSPDPCRNSPCNNGADCGEGCGCLDGQCVPCDVLECLGLCEQALGCRCNGNKCEAIEDCNEYCDGDLACSDPDCTCYNNKCVKCDNFPCSPDDCSSRVNCKCNDGKCDGGDGCKDSLKLQKECGSGVSDCKLKAKLTFKDKCNCDDIRVEVKNTTNCTQSSSKITLDVSLFKGQTKYSDFTNISIGDNEFIEGIISTRIVHYDKNNNIVDVKGLSTITDKSIVGNLVAPIEILKNTHYSTDGYRVKIIVVAKDVKIPNNGCINYGKEVVVVEYILDFTAKDTLQHCTIINNSIKQRESYLNDKTSSKIPLFIWSKSSTDFPNGKYQDNGNYNSKGWFRKVYGYKTSTGWEDKIETVEDGLVNNYNYFVKVDCGCSKTAVHNKLDFCCFSDVSFSTSNCNRTLNIINIPLCKINGKIDSTNVPDFNKAYYKLVVTLKGGAVKEFNLQINNNKTSITPYTYNSDETIINAKIVRYFKGGLLMGNPCEYELPLEKIDIPSVSYNGFCLLEDNKYRVVVNQTNGTMRISKVEFLLIDDIDGAQGYLNNPVVIFGNSNVKTIDILLKSGGGIVDFSQHTIKLVITFDSGCKEIYDLPSCDPNIKLVPDPDIYANDNCPDGSSAPNLIVETYGFTNNVQFSLGNNVYQSSNVFTNLSAGTYTVYAKDIINGVEVIKEATITILPKMETDVYFTPSNLCANQKSTLTIKGEPNRAFSIYGANGNLINGSAITNNDGVYTLNNISQAGEYTITSNSNSNKYCKTNKKLTLTSGGETLTPMFVFQSGTYCVGEPIPFRIFDNGEGRTYNVSTTNGTITSPITAINSGFNGYYTPSSLTGSVRIDSSTSSCDSMAQVVITSPPNGVSIVTAPVIGLPSVACVGNLHTVSVTVTNASSVKIGDVTVTPVGNVYTRTGISGVPNIDIEATNGSCTIKKNVILQSCDCPSYSALIQISPTTCEQGSQTIVFTGYSPNLIGKSYQLQTLIGGVWVDIAGESGVFNEPTPVFTIYNQEGNDSTYRVHFDDGSCTVDTNEVQTSVQSQPVVTITSDKPNPIASGLPFTLTANVSNIYPGTPISYLWAGAGVSGKTTQSVTTMNATAGTYTYSVTVNVGSCTVTSTYVVEINQNCNLTASISAQNHQCGTLTANAYGGSGAYSYEWSIAGNLISTNKVVTNHELVPGGDQIVSLKVTDTLGCEAFATVAHNSCVNKTWVISNTGNTLGTEQCDNVNNIYKVTAITKIEVPCDVYIPNTLFVEYYINDGGGDVFIIDHKWNLYKINGSETNCGYTYTQNGKQLKLPLGTYGDNSYTVKAKLYIGNDNTGEYLGIVDLGIINVPASC